LTRSRECTLEALQDRGDHFRMCISHTPPTQIHASRRASRAPQQSHSTAGRCLPRPLKPPA
jgi:hypothetical protein